ncbi:MAG: arginine--tRNA ligase [Rhodospirillales bacterium]|nr:MAG: arginine--tRNA ligase [Rhodospirillales bacterium]
MNLFRHFERAVAAAVDALAAEGALPQGLDTTAISVEPPRDPGHGDVTTNAAMVLARPAKRKPRDLAEALAGRLAELDAVDRVEVAGPGFINLGLAPGFWYARLRDVLAAGPSYGDSALGAGRPVNVEFVSANPTGPLHVGHGRGAVVGDALAALLAKAGWRVTREYYVNDAGGQVDGMARSIHFRYLIAVGARTQADFDRARSAGELQYAGDYLQNVADAIREEDGARWVDAPEADWLPVFRHRGVAVMLADIMASLDRLGIRFDVVASERALVDRGDVLEVIEALRQAGHIYTGVLEPPKGKLPDDWEPRPQTLFRATAFGDDTDRPLQKSDGSWTYFASDIAYHRDKFRRGFATMIDVWGADHGGYVKRMQASVKAITGGAGDLDVKLCQMVNLLDRGQPVKMSKRAGTYVTLDEVVERVGRDVFRFMMLTRKNDAQLDFDFAKVTEQTKDNPVFYVQYAHARCCSVIRHAAAELGDAVVADSALESADLAKLTDEGELAIIKTIAQWPRVVENAATAHEPHRIAYYLQDLASAFHLLWTRGKDDTELRFVTVADKPLTQARLALVRGVQLVVASGLAVFGVRPVEELR